MTGVLDPTGYTYGTVPPLRRHSETGVLELAVPTPQGDGVALMPGVLDPQSDPMNEYRHAILPLVTDVAGTHAWTGARACQGRFGERLRRRVTSMRASSIR